MTQNRDVKVIRLGKLVRIPMSQFEKEENKEKAWKDVVFKGAQRIYKTKTLKNRDKYLSFGSEK